jgi:hypothetical protein
VSEGVVRQVLSGKLDVVVVVLGWNSFIDKAIGLISQ